MMKVQSFAHVLHGSVGQLALSVL